MYLDFSAFNPGEILQLFVCLILLFLFGSGMIAVIYYFFKKL